MKHLALTLVFGLALAVSASASLSASAFLTFQQDGSNWDYDIHLTNTGDTTIGTLWYAWVPGLGFLPDPPSNISGPSGWNNGVATDGNKSIQWIANTLLNPGDSIDGFKFTSADSPTTLAGNAGQFPIGTSFVYSKQPFSDGGFQFTIEPVPEPMTILALGIGVAGVMRRRAKRA